MIKLKTKENCCGCHACKNACPESCISMITDEEGFLYPNIDHEICNECGICQKVCPMLSEIIVKDQPIAYAAWNKNSLIRESSSSGGVFHALMEGIFDDKGVVFGAAFNDAFVLKHQSSYEISEALKFRGSKYVQSIVGDSYREARKILKSGRKVLYSGTPCQIAGLYSYLGKDYSNLITCDVVCHGVPSPKVFSAYQESLEKKYNRKIQQIDFRNKRTGWKRYSILFSFDDNSEYCKIFPEDPFMIGFLRDIYLRPSCYECRFSRIPRIADISLGDFWGVHKHHPQWDDDKGTSLILVQSKKGKEIFSSISDKIVVHLASLNAAVVDNLCICGSVPLSFRRKNFFSDFYKLTFEEVMMEYMLPYNRFRSMFNKVKKIFYKYK